MEHQEHPPPSSADPSPGPRAGLLPKSAGGLMAPVFSQMNSLLLKLLTQRTRACLCGWVCLCTRARWRTHKRARTQAHVKKHLEEVGGDTRSLGASWHSSRASELDYCDLRLHNIYKHTFARTQPLLLLYRLSACAGLQARSRNV